MTKYVPGVDWNDAFHAYSFSGRCCHHKALT